MQPAKTEQPVVAKGVKREFAGGFDVKGNAALRRLVPGDGKIAGIRLGLLPRRRFMAEHDSLEYHLPAERAVEMPEKYRRQCSRRFETKECPTPCDALDVCVDYLWGRHQHLTGEGEPLFVSEYFESGAWMGAFDKPE